MLDQAHAPAARAGRKAMLDRRALYENRLEREIGEVSAIFDIQGWVKDDTRWEPPSISVCWESMDPAFATEREWVENSLTRTWEAHSAVDFTDFGGCAPKSRGIRVAVADAEARTLGLGKEVGDVPNGLRLNFTFGRWNNWCAKGTDVREKCIRSNAVHEFGHALGFVHEHNRHDTDRNVCKVAAQGPKGDRILTPWDPDSIMNYCNEERTRRGDVLSPNDIVAVSLFYPRKA